MGLEPGLRPSELCEIIICCSKPPSYGIVIAAHMDEDTAQIPVNRKPKVEMLIAQKVGCKLKGINTLRKDGALQM